MGRGSVLAVRSIDPVLSVAGPIGLAASVKTALVVDMAGGLSLGGHRTLADIAAEGPTLDELSPGRSGVAFIRGGPIPWAEATVILDELARRWPSIVVRAGDRDWDGPTVPVVPLYPGFLEAIDRSAAVWQPVGAATRPPGPGPVLPGLGPGLARKVLLGRLPGRSRWVNAWGQVWDLPWA